MLIEGICVYSTIVLCKISELRPQFYINKNTKLNSIKLYRIVFRVRYIV